MSDSLVLAQRAMRESLRTPEALLPTLFIPLFFLVVNVGQAARIFPSETTSFLEGQNYAAFQLPSSILLAASFGSAALYLVEDIEGGYFDKLRASPVSRTAIVFGRLAAEAAKSVAITTAMVLVALPFGIRIASGPLGFLLLIAMAAGWAVVFSGFMQLIGAEDAQRRGDQLGGPDLLPAALPHPELRPAGPAHPAHGDRGHVQPGHLHHGGAPLADPRGPRVGGHRPRASRSWPSRAR